MATRMLSKTIRKLITKNAAIRQTKFLSTNSRLLAAGINDELYGLSEDQKEFRQTVYDFCQKELAPHADKIDKDNGWDNLRYIF